MKSTAVVFKLYHNKLCTLDFAYLCLRAGHPHKVWIKDVLQIVSLFDNLEPLNPWPLLPVKQTNLRALSSASQVPLSCNLDFYS